MALPNDLQRTCDLIGACNVSDPNFSGDTKKSARSLIRKTIKVTTPATNANASNAINANVADSVRMKSAGRVLGAYWISQGAAITANGTNFATVSVFPLDGTGNTGNAAASQTTKDTANGGSGNIAANGGSITLTVSAANARYVKGTWLAGQVSMTASGVAMPAGVLCVDVEEEDVDGYAV